MTISFQKRKDIAMTMNAHSFYIMEQKIIRLLNREGPLTGQELLNALHENEFLLWRTCKASNRIVVQTLGTRYLRLDRRIQGYARLSPSILREFLTYSVIGLPDNPLSLNRKADDVLQHIETISTSKSNLAYSVISSLADLFQEDALMEHTCFILAGDIVYNMAHDAPRPERSTGKMVNGSDMDIIVIVDDELPTTQMKRLDEAIYQEKYRLLIAPHLREEIDYVVKDLKRVRDQVRFDTFKHMVACKILHEGTRLYGSEAIFHQIKTILKETGVDQKLSEMEARSLVFREKAEETLLHEDPDLIKAGFLGLFFPSEESEEFE